MLEKLKGKYPIQEVFIIDRGAIDLMFNTFIRNNIFIVIKFIKREIFKIGYIFCNLLIMHIN